jgi:hypothetical protein
VYVGRTNETGCETRVVNTGNVNVLQSFWFARRKTAVMCEKSQDFARTEFILFTLCVMHAGSLSSPCFFVFDLIELRLG